ncbi:MAG: formylglycine-generating enzyme family protein, partial [Verrucomicrobiota bacterium]
AAQPLPAPPPAQTIPPTWSAGGQTRRGPVPSPDSDGRPGRTEPAAPVAPTINDTTTQPRPPAASASGPAERPREALPKAIMATAVLTGLILAVGLWYFLAPPAPPAEQAATPAPAAPEPATTAAPVPVVESDAGDELAEAATAKQQAETLIALARAGGDEASVGEALAVAYAGSSGAQRRFQAGELRAARDLWRAAAASAAPVAVTRARERHETALPGPLTKILADYAPTESAAILAQLEQAGRLAEPDPLAAITAYDQATSLVPSAREAAAKQISELARKAVAAKDQAMALYFHELELRLRPDSQTAQAYLYRHKFKPGQTLALPVGLDLVYVPPGEFTQGSPANEPGRDTDEIQRKVTLTRGFYLGATEVTQRAWDRLMGANDAATRIRAARLKPEFIGADKPMILVTWAEAQEFCRRLGEQDQARYRLPTEAEWEYACRAGTTTAFNTGVGLGLNNANIDDGSARVIGAPAPVATIGTATVWGLHDLHGNAWEWCADWSAPYAAGATTDPTGPSDDKIGRPDLAMKVVRGGSWNDGANEARSGNRWAYSPVVVTSYIGFRVLREIDFSSQP